MLTKPAITLVDDDPQTLKLLLDALARRFGGDYQVVAHLSATAALKDLDRVKAEGWAGCADHRRPADAGDAGARVP